MDSLCTQTSRNRRKALWMSVGFLITLSVGDGIFARIPWGDLYGSRNWCRYKWDLYDRSASPPEVVYLGCSYEWYGINPRVVDAEVGRVSGARVTSLNLSSSAASMVTNYLLARRIVESGRLPKVAYLDVSPDATDVSQRGWLRNGLRALGNARDLPLAASVGGDVFWETLQNATFRSYHRWEDVQIAVGRMILAAPINPKLKMRFDDRGWAEWIGGKRELSGSVPSPEEVRLHQGSWGTRQDGNQNAVALRRTIEMLVAAGVTVRLLEMPMSSVVPPWDRHDSNDAYREMINATTADLAAPVVRPPMGSFTDADFYDPIHLNPEGAVKFSRWLAQDVAAALGSALDENESTVLAEHGLGNRQP